MEFDAIPCLGMFFAAFSAATLLPAQSELVLAGLLAAGKQPVWLVLAAAITGNTLGSAANWLLGAYFCRFRNRRWFPVSEERLDKAISWYHRYGRWSLLASWAPFIGDPLTLVAGMLREPFWSFFLIVFLAKSARYLVIAGLTLP